MPHHDKLLNFAEEDEVGDAEDKPSTEDPSKKKKTEEGYKNMMSIITEMYEQPTQKEYKNLHNMIREITNGRS
tara:strand:+ start:1994 stop:2212 length:219 start_codon:yes stop_codon:yes gene_type:complete